MKKLFGYFLNGIKFWLLVIAILLIVYFLVFGVIAMEHQIPFIKLIVVIILCIIVTTLIGLLFKD